MQDAVKHFYLVHVYKEKQKWKSITMECKKRNAICVNGPFALQYSEIKYRGDLIL